MSSKIKPLGDKVVVRPDKAESMTVGGIYIPETAKETPQRGVVVSVGDKDDLTVKEGDIVIYSQMAGSEIHINGDELLIMRESDIFGII